MAEILPFRGMRFDEHLAGRLSNLIAPPYDVIDATMQDKLYARSPHNVVRLTLPKPAPEERPYARSAATMRDWLERGVLMRDADPGIYVIEQHFSAFGKPQRRTGMIALARLMEPGQGIHPHEYTLSGAKADRLNLLRATRANLGHVFGLYDDPDNRIDALLEEAKIAPAIGEAKDLDHNHHLLWVIRDVAAIGAIRNAMRNLDILIADGHHRYETSLAYMKEHPESPAARYRMLTLVNLRHAGLVILPTHRLLKNLPNFDARRLLASMGEAFEIKTIAGAGDPARKAMFAAMKQAFDANRHAFGFFAAEGNHYVFTLRDENLLPAAADRGKEWRKLDVSILHGFVLERFLDIKPEDLAAERYVEYVKDFAENIAAAHGKVAAGAHQALFYLNPTRMDEVAAVAIKGERMPQKSTFFYPKVYAGMVMRLLDDNEDYV